MMLENWRRELLDLGLRNPLLNYRLLKARGVRIEGELSAEIHTILVKRQQTMSFDATAEEGDSAELLQPPTSYTDQRLQTTHSDSDLQKRLLNSEHSARTIINNRGINVLYLALGMLHWYESESSTVVRRAPLLLIPVELTRADINDRFHVRYTGVDLDENLSLRAKLQQEFNITLPSFPNRTLHLPAYFHRIRDAIKSKPRWSVIQDEISLGFFSFSKFMLYHDLLALDKRSHPLLDRLLHVDGIREPASTYDEGVPLDEQMQLADSNLVLDADSSQMKVLLDVRAGRNLVVQGPPGTGKSQTITNLIADAVGRGKTVLFVSEKMAALDVVKRRLDQVGVGDSALVLHSHRATRGHFYNEIRRTLQLELVTEIEGQSLDFPQLDEFQQTQARLIEYSEAVNRPIAALNTTQPVASPYHLYGRLLQLREKLKNLTLPANDLATWRDIAYEVLARLPDIREKQSIRQHIVVVDQHPFAGTTHKQPLDATTLAQIETQSTLTLNLLQQVQHIASTLTTRLQQPAATTLAEVRQLLKLTDQAAHTPRLNGIDIHHEEWATIDAETIADALQAMMQVERHKLQYKRIVLPEAWAEPVVKIRQGLMSGRTWWERVRSPDYRIARSQLAGLCQRDMPTDWDDLIKLVDTILDVQRLDQQIAPYQTQLTRLFGSRVREGQWHELARATYWLHTAHEHKMPRDLLQLLANDDDPSTMEPLHDELVDLMGTLEKSLAVLWQTVAMPDGESIDLAQLAELLANWIKTPARINEMVALNRVADQLCAFPPIVDALYHWSLAGNYLADWAEFSVVSLLLNDAYLQRPLLLGSSPHQSAELFRDLDRAFLQHNQLRLAQRHWEKLPRYQAGGLVGRMHKLLAYKRPSLPIRKFIQAFGDAVFRIKPVFMMSPLAIAAYLPSDRITFDLVIFDEASQVRPAEALGAIARARQFVVVGDSRQLPPTAFFESLGEESSELDELVMDDVRVSAESILNLCLIQHVPERMLQWHYRSRHESLIAIANASFYDHELVIFPSPDRAKQHVGLNFRHVPEGVYERGGSRSNPIEAHAIAQAVMHHAKKNPDQTLGVATFSRSQREAVSNALERLRRADPSCESFFNAHPQEPFFVKNLENVQGDERDVMLISVGYGKSQDSKLRLNFGPLNAKGGERRLNVLTTRARERCDVFANFRAAEIDLKRTQSVGVAALKRYMAFAETGELDAPPVAQQRPIAPFETLVARRLTDAGYYVVQRVGSRSMQVDLAVADPSNPQQFILGIECDADSHRAEATRDRVRIQDEVLTGLGWAIYRLYMVNWWKDEAGTFQHLLEAIEVAKRGEKVWRFGRISIPHHRLQQTATHKKPTPRPLPLYQFATDPLNLAQCPPNWRHSTIDTIKMRPPIFFDPDRQLFIQTQTESSTPFAAHLSYSRLSNSFEIQFEAPESVPCKQVPHRSGYLHHSHLAPEIILDVMVEIKWIMMVLHVENPIHITELIRRIHKLGRRKGHSKLLQKRITAGYGHADRLGLVQKKGDFVYLTDQSENIPPRNRRQAPKTTRDAKMVSNEEFKSALLLAVRDAIEIEFDSLWQEVRQMLGLLSSPNGGYRKHFLPLLAELCQTGQLIYENNAWRYVA